MSDELRERDEAQPPQRSAERGRDGGDEHALASSDAVAHPDRREAGEAPISLPPAVDAGEMQPAQPQTVDEPATAPEARDDGAAGMAVHETHEGPATADADGVAAGDTGVLAQAKASLISLIPTIEPARPVHPTAGDAASKDGGKPTDPAGLADAPAAAGAPLADAAEPVRAVTRAVAEIIPFVPRPRIGGAGGPVRPSSPAELQGSGAFERPAVPFFARRPAQQETRAPTTAQPPPPDGYRRPGDSARMAQGPVEVPAWQTAKAQQLSRAASAWAASFSWRRALLMLLRLAAGAVAAYATLVLALLVAYRWVDPPMSSLMLSQRFGGTAVTQRWVPIDRISPNLLQAVVLSEDGQFCRHRGVDWSELREAIGQSMEGQARGGSTITMQLVKNLYLWPSKSYLRKAVELPLALLTELVWPKQRTLEIYLNIAEWGPGIFGAEAAAQYHFHKPAQALSAREAALLAVSLPNPFERQAGHPGAGTQRLAEVLQARMRRAPNVAACARSTKPR